MTCFEELAQQVNDIIPLSFTGSSRYHFDVGVTRSALEDGRKRIPRDDVFVLVAKLIGDLDEHQVSAIRKGIRERLASPDNVDLSWGDSRKSTVITACSGYLSPIWDVARLLRDIWTSTRGTPEIEESGHILVQAITLGSLLVEHGTNDQITLKDRRGHRCVSLAEHLVHRSTDERDFDARSFQVTIADDALRRSKELENVAAPIGSGFAVEFGNRQHKAYIYRERTVLMAFDVFLSHNSKDKPTVRQLFETLESSYGLRVWYDEEELPPGIPWQPLLEKGIRNSTSAAVVIGNDGLGPWEDQEMQAALNLAVQDGRPVIPVLLPTATRQPVLPLFLSNRTWVDFRGGFTQDKLDRLVWGITGLKPGKSSTGSGQPAQRSTPPKHNSAMKLWEEKLDFLRQQEALATDPSQQFSLKKLIEQAEQKIRNYGGTP